MEDLCNMVDGGTLALRNRLVVAFKTILEILRPKCYYNTLCNIFIFVKIQVYLLQLKCI